MRIATSLSCPCFCSRALAAAAAFALTLLLPGCAVLGIGHTFYRCDNGVTLDMKNGESITAETGRGRSLLLRDAGGLTPQQAVYSNPQMRVETGLGIEGRGATIEGAVPNVTGRCQRV